MGNPVWKLFIELAAIWQLQLARLVKQVKLADEAPGYQELNQPR